MKPDTLQKLSRAASFMDAVSVQFGKAAAVAAYLLLFFIMLHVALRYIFNLNLIQLEEVHWHLYAVIFLLGFGYTYVNDGHVRVDLFFESMSPRAKAWVNLLGVLLLLLPFCLIVGYFSVQYFWASWLVREGSDQPGALPARYILKFFLVLGLGILTWQGIAVLLRSLYVLGGGQPEPVSRDIEGDVRL